MGDVCVCDGEGKWEMCVCVMGRGSGRCVCVCDGEGKWEMCVYV